MGKISIFKVLSGAIKKDQNFYDISKDKELKASNIFYLRGKEQFKAEKLLLEILEHFLNKIFFKLEILYAQKESPIEYKKIKYPRPVLYYAIEAESKNDEDKISAALKNYQKKILLLKIEEMLKPTKKFWQDLVMFNLKF